MTIPLKASSVSGGSVCSEIQTRAPRRAPALVVTTKRYWPGHLQVSSTLSRTNQQVCSRICPIPEKKNPSPVYLWIGFSEKPNPTGTLEGRRAGGADVSSTLLWSWRVGCVPLPPPASCTRLSKRRLPWFRVVWKGWDDVRQTNCSLSSGRSVWLSTRGWDDSPFAVLGAEISTRARPWPAASRYFGKYFRDCLEVASSSLWPIPLCTRGEEINKPWWGRYKLSSCSVANPLWPRIKWVENWCFE